MRLRCEQEDLRRQLQSEKEAADELQAELTSEMRELRDKCHEQERDPIEFMLDFRQSMSFLYYEH